MSLIISSFKTSGILEVINVIGSPTGEISNIIGILSFGLLTIILNWLIVKLSNSKLISFSGISKIAFIKLKTVPNKQYKTVAIKLITKFETSYKATVSYCHSLGTIITNLTASTFLHEF